MKDALIVTLYANAVALMMGIGVFVLAYRFKMKDPLEKKIFLLLQIVVMIMAVFYVLCGMRDALVFPCSKMGAMLLDTGFELMINIFAMEWFIYTDYRMYHSPDHVKRNLVRFLFPFSILTILTVVNVFTEILFYFTDDMVLVERPLYIVTDLIRVGYFVASIVVLAVYKKNSNKMKFFKILPFFIPMMLYIAIYYFTPYATVALGLTIGLTLIYVEMVNEQCYQDNETGFYNRLYFEFIRDQAGAGKYKLEGALLIRLPSGELKDRAALISKQLPTACDAIRYTKDTILTLAAVSDRGALHLLSEDVSECLADSDIDVTIKYDLKKKKESETEFLDRFLEKVK